MSDPAQSGFVHLRVRSAYSLLEGAIKAGKIGRMAADAGMPAVAVADRANLFGALEFSQTAKEAGVQPIVACALPVLGIGGQVNARWAKTPTVVLLAQNETGWLNLCALSSAAYLDAGEMAEPGVHWSQVAARSDGLILLSGGPCGPIDPLFVQGKTEEAHAALAALREAFGDRFYVELQRHGLDDERRAERGLVAWAYDNDVPLVATNDVYYAKAAQAKSHDALLCIADGAFTGQEERRRVTGEHWFKSAEAMRALFADLPEACDNTLDVARRCAFLVKTHKPILPRFDTGAGRSEPEHPLQCDRRVQRPFGRDGQLRASADQDPAGRWRRCTAGQFGSGRHELSFGSGRRQRHDQLRAEHARLPVRLGFDRHLQHADRDQHEGNLRVRAG